MNGMRLNQQCTPNTYLEDPVLYDFIYAKIPVIQYL